MAGTFYPTVIYLICRPFAADDDGDDGEMTIMMMMMMPLMNPSKG